MKQCYSLQDTADFNFGSGHHSVFLLNDGTAWTVGHIWSFALLLLNLLNLQIHPHHQIAGKSRSMLLTMFEGNIVLISRAGRNHYGQLCDRSSTQQLSLQILPIQIGHLTRFRISSEDNHAANATNSGVLNQSLQSTAALATGNRCSWSFVFFPGAQWRGYHSCKRRLQSHAWVADALQPEVSTTLSMHSSCFQINMARS